jgi:FAD/FMN-containing dehydrogenase
VITARCGTPLSLIEATLAEHGQFLPFEPPTFGVDPTIGGVIAAGLSGPRRAFAGAARDFVLGASLLDANGEWVSKQRFIRELFLTQSGACIFEHHWPIEHSKETDSYGFKSYRILQETRTLSML